MGLPLGVLLTLGLLTQRVLCKHVELSGEVCEWACKEWDACVLIGGPSLSCSLCTPLSDPDLSSPGTAGTAGKLVLLNNITKAEAFISSAEVAVVGFFQVCS